MKKDIKITYKGQGVPNSDIETHISSKNIPTKLVVVSNSITYPIEECEFFTNGVLHTKLEEKPIDIEVDGELYFELRTIETKTFLIDWFIQFSNFTFTNGIY